MQALGKHGIICIEDLVHEIHTCGPAFKQVSIFCGNLHRPNKRLGCARLTYACTTHFEKFVLGNSYAAVFADTNIVSTVTWREVLDFGVCNISAAHSGHVPRCLIDVAAPRLV